MLILLVVGVVLILAGLAGLFHLIAIGLPVAVAVVVVGLLLVMVGGGMNSGWGNRQWGNRQQPPPGPPPGPTNT